MTDGVNEVLPTILPFDAARDRALALLASGQPIGVPTETVYGLAADATNGQAVARIFEIKGRPQFNPLIAHVCDMAMAERCAKLPALARVLAEAFWPGPLTMVLPLADESPVHPLVCAGLDTVALRMPQGPARDLIADFGRPLAAPSANRSGRISPTTAQAVIDDLEDRIALVIDAGPTPVGLESTIIKVGENAIELLRPGGITAEAIEAATDRRPARPSGSAVQAPGMLASHYAPKAAMRLDAEAARPGEALLAFGPQASHRAGEPVAMLNLSEKADLAEAAANLFSFMRRLDHADAHTIAVQPIPHEGLGEAINDRLARAAAPRDKPAASA